MKTQLNLSALFLALSMFVTTNVLGQLSMQFGVLASSSIEDVVLSDSNTVLTTGGNAFRISIDGGRTFSGFNSSGMFNKAASYPSLKFAIVVGNAGKYRINTQCGYALGWSSPYSVGVSTDLLDVHFTNNQMGYVCGVSGVLVRTTDQGKNWTKISTNTLYNINGVYSPNDSIAFACGDSGLVLKVKNTTLISSQRICTSKLNKIEFTNDSTGYVVGNAGVIYKTTDAGTTWTQLSIATKANLMNLNFSSQNFGVVVGDSSKIFYTNDAGAFWNKSKNPLLGKNLSVALRNEKEGFVVGVGFALKTIDGGLNWKKTEVSTNAVRFITKEVGYAFGNEATAYRTLDSGKTWNPITAPYVITDMCALNTDTIFIVGGDSIYRTTDACKTWTRINNPSDNALHSVYFTDINNGTAVGAYRTIMHTKDGGKTWKFSTTTLNSMAYSPAYSDIKFTSPLVGYFICSEDATVRKTTDGGVSWTVQSTAPNTNVLYGTYFLDNQTGWLVGDKGTILHTSNGGTSWTSQTSGIPADFLSGVYFLNKDTGVVVGEYGTYLLTFNGGATWTKKPMSTSHDFRDIFFTDIDHAYAVSSSSYIWCMRPFSIPNFDYAFCPGESVSFNTFAPYHNNKNQLTAVFELTDENDDFSNSLVMDTISMDSVALVDVKVPLNLNPGIYQIRIRDINNSSRTSKLSYMRLLDEVKLNVFKRDSFLVVTSSNKAAVLYWYYRADATKAYQVQTAKDSIKIVAAGDYYVTTTANCCIVTSEIWNIGLCNGALSVLNASNKQSICPGESIQVGIHTYNKAGVYVDTLMNSLGCDSIVTTTLSIKPSPIKPMLKAVNGNLICLSKGMADYDWYRDNYYQMGDKDSCQLSEGKWHVVVTNSYGCNSTSEAFEYKSPALFVKDVQVASALDIYPNPNSGQFIISLKDITDQSVHLSVFSLRGEILYSQTKQLTTNQQELFVNLGSIAQGHYVLQVQAGAKTYNSKLIVE